MNMFAGLTGDLTHPCQTTDLKKDAQGYYCGKCTTRMAPDYEQWVLTHKGWDALRQLRAQCQS